MLAQWTTLILPVVESLPVVHVLSGVLATVAAPLAAAQGAALGAIMSAVAPVLALPGVMVASLGTTLSHVWGGSALVGAVADAAVLLGAGMVLPGVWLQNAGTMGTQVAMWGVMWLQSALAPMVTFWNTHVMNHLVLFLRSHLAM